jgi:glycyl-tRNA synthetase beta chain
MPELLLEVGCEELPAVFVRKAYTDLLARLTSALAELYDTSFEGSACGTPRRLIVAVHDVPARQPNSVKEVRPGRYKAFAGPRG